MNFYKNCFVQSLLSITLAFSPIFCAEVEVNTEEGDHFIIEIAPEDTFISVLEQIDLLTERSEDHLSPPMVTDDFLDTPENKKYYFAIAFSDPEFNQIGPIGTRKPHDYRNYHVPISKDEKKNISYIVKTLSNKSLVKLLSLKSSLKKVGDKVNHVHPLRFLMCIFTDEELKAGIHNISTRGWVWSDFMKGISGSLSDEANRNNLGPELVVDFSQKVGIDHNKVIHHVNERRWEEFVKTLIQFVPRQGDPNRYDM
jgi:hypothetical protein